MADGKSDSQATSAQVAESGNAVDTMLDQLVKSGQADQMKGLDIDRLRAAMNAPGAAETIAAIQALGADSQAGAGQQSPDFVLPYLPGQGKPDGEKVRLSEHFENRPVALVFGSYT